MDSKFKKSRLVILIQIIISLFLVIGAGWAGKDVNILFHSYFADIFLPFGFYFLLVMNADKTIFLNRWWKRVAAILGLTFVLETLQYFGIYALGTVFDPLDYLMYVIGTLFAAFMDRKVLIRFFSFWS